MAESTAVKLLVVEDSFAYLQLIREAFGNRRESIRWELTVANDGQQAIDFLFREEKRDEPLPDLVLLDWNLPKISGDGVLRRMKEHSKLRRIPVLVFSSSESEDDIHAAYDYHANGYITKPQSVSVLYKVVEAIEQFWVAIAQLPKLTRGGVS